MQNSDLSMYYLAYGSNLHPQRLKRRIRSAEYVGKVELPGFQLRFHKVGQDHSGKCNLVETGISTDRIHGAVFKIANSDKRLLDEFEGNGKGYLDKTMSIVVSGQECICFVYLAQSDYINDDLCPFQWYQQLVLLGAEFHGFPENYIERFIRSIATIRDPDPIRNLSNEGLVAELGKTC